MNNSKLLPVGLVAIMAVVSGYTVASAQTAMDTEVQAPKVMNVDFRGHGGKHGKRGGRGMMHQILQKVDADGDGAVTQAEIDAFRSALVSEADASGDGNISIAEFETIYLQMVRNKMVDAFQRLDEDGDGMVTQAEMDEKFGNVVERMDRNDDGKLDRGDRRGGDRKGHGRDGERRGDRRG
ncbi:EF hand [Hoeflea sp. IMCC20628]|uniref:EF-hand domain-containing protein n=1 Tax=Hoeflea sp. IMCC20628 TaxID=1620421 RepID=UPI00063BEA4A|nr:hypothetical protein [Hoeflea sp. IMCC20628]AKI00728.1 EF hand [Hoeflea sp. IMCC20628]